MTRALAVLRAVRLAWAILLDVCLGEPSGRHLLPGEPVPYWPAYLPAPAPAGAPGQAPRPGATTTPAPRGAVRAGQAEDAGATPAAVTGPPVPAGAAPLAAPPSPVGRGEHPYGGALAVRHLGMPPWEPARRPDGPEPEPRRPRVTATGNTGAIRTVSWHLVRRYAVLRYPPPSCPDDRAGWASAAYRNARTVTA